MSSNTQCSGCRIVIVAYFIFVISFLLFDCYIPLDRQSIYLLGIDIYHQDICIYLVNSGENAQNVSLYTIFVANCSEVVSHTEHGTRHNDGKRITDASGLGIGNVCVFNYIT